MDKDYIEEVRQIQESFGDLIHHTPLNKNHTFSKMCHNEIYLKFENVQRTGSFKIRGAYNKILKLSDEQRKRGIITASAGNHGQALALAAKLFNVKSFVVIPEAAPIVKIEAIKNYNPLGEVIEFGSTYDEAYQEAKKISKKRNLTFIHAYDDYDVIQGQATIGIEIMEQLPDVDYIFCPIGGGGLISGISTYCKKIKPSIKIIGVQSENAKSMMESFKNNVIKKIPVKPTICDGIAVKKPGNLTFELIKKNVDDIVLVSDEEVANSILLLMERAKTFVEGAGAAALAAILNQRIKIKDKKVVIILSGGNLTPNLINRIISKGLIKEGRLVKFKLSIPDTPGELLKILNIIAAEKGNIISITHDRERLKLEYQSSEVIIEIETRNFDHINEIISKLKNSFKIEILAF